MNVHIEFETRNAAFEDDFPEQVELLLDQVHAKLLVQIDRDTDDVECICDTPEAADVLLDINGNRVGKLWITKDNNDGN